MTEDGGFDRRSFLVGGIMAGVGRGLAVAKTMYDAARVVGEKVREVGAIAREALALYEEIGDWLGRAHTLAHIGEHRQACEIVREIGAAGELARFERPPGATSEPLGSLTSRELQVAKLFASGRSSRDVGAHLNIDRRTVETHVANIYAKVTIRTRGELAERLRGWA